MHCSRPLFFAAALLAPMASQAALSVNAECNVESTYGIEVDTDRIGFTRKASDPDGVARIEFVDGVIRVDGKTLTLSDADRQRARRFGQKIQALVPEVRQIAAEGVEIAFVALSRVATHFASEARRDVLLQELDALRQEAVQAIAQARSSDTLRDSLLEQRIEAAVKRMVPVIAGEFAAQAVSAAMSGDTQAAADIERRASALGAEIERSTAGVAKALEARIARLCPKLQSLDALENSFEWRMPDGSHPQLLEYTHTPTAEAVEKS